MHIGGKQDFKSAICTNFEPPWPWPWPRIGSYGIQ